MFKPAIALSFALTAAIQSSACFAADIDPKLEAAIRAKGAEVLADPYSAVYTFDIVRPYGSVGGKICGTVNAKNGFGAYVGPRFMLVGYMKQGDAYTVLMMNVADFTLADALTRPKICE